MVLVVAGAPEEKHIKDLKNLHSDSMKRSGKQKIALNAHFKQHDLLSTFLFCFYIFCIFLPRFFHFAFCWQGP